MRYPFSDLETAVRTTNASHLAELIGVDRTVIYRWRRNGLTFDKADELAVKFGFVPENIWPAWREDANERAAVLEAEDQAKADARRKTERDRKRQRYWNDPVFRAETLKKGRRYHEECRDFVLFSKRQRYRANAETAKAKSRAYYAANRESVKERVRLHRAAQAS